MKKIFLTLVLSAICGFASAQKAPTLSVEDIEIVPGDKVSFALTVNVGERVVTGFEYHGLIIPDGLELTSATTTNTAFTGGSISISKDQVNGFCTSMQGAKIPQNEDFEIGTIEVQVKEGATITPGSELTFTFPANSFFFFNTEEKYYVEEEVSFTAKVVSAYTVVLDETSTTAPEPATGVNVTVKRTINAKEWGTIVLPFEMSEEQVKNAFGTGVQIKDFTGYEYNDGDDNVKVNFQTVTAIEKNHPYIIKVNEKVTEFTVEGVDIDPEESPSVSFGYTTGSGKNKVYHPSDFIGTYVADFDFFGNAASYPLFLSGGQFWYASEQSQHMMAFRAYFDFDGYPEWVEENQVRFVMVFDEQTGISNVTTFAEGEYYDLKGQRVETPSKGIYIKDGKKVVVK